MLGPPYALKEHESNSPLEKISPLSERAWALLVRKRDIFGSKAGFENVCGAVDMMLGMQYHHDAFLRRIEEAADSSITIRSPVRDSFLHESIAYLNRVGQFYYFASSSFVVERIPDWEMQIPLIGELIRVRHKHAAHRSLDQPRKEDTKHLQSVHAWAFSSVGPLHFENKPGTRLKPADIINNPASVWRNTFTELQLLGNTDEHTMNFSIEKDHHVVESECYGIVSKLLDAIGS